MLGEGCAGIDCPLLAPLVFPSLWRSPYHVYRVSISGARLFHHSNELIAACRPALVAVVSVTTGRVPHLATGVLAAGVLATGVLLPLASSTVHVAATGVLATVCSRRWRPRRWRPSGGWGERSCCGSQARRLGCLTPGSAVGAAPGGAHGGAGGGGSPSAAAAPWDAPRSCDAAVGPWGTSAAAAGFERLWPAARGSQVRRLSCRMDRRRRCGGPRRCPLEC